MATPTTKRTKIEASSGNVFADLGLADATELNTKAGLAAAINRLTGTTRRRRAAAAKRLGVSQRRISALVNYRLDSVSVETLLSHLLALGQNVEIRIAPRRASKSPAKIVVQTS